MNEDGTVSVVLQSDDGTEFKVDVDAATFLKLTTDNEYFAQFHQSLLTQTINLPPEKSSNILEQALLESNITLDTAGTSSRSSDPSQEETLNNKETTVKDEVAEKLEEGGKEDDDKENSNDTKNPLKRIKWTEAATLLLIETRLRLNKDFSDSKCKKKAKLWDKVLQEFRNFNYTRVTRDDLSRKWTNLFMTYTRNVDKLNSTGESAVSWDHFEKMHAVLGSKKSIDPPKISLRSTLQHEAAVKPVIQVTKDSDGSDSDSGASQSQENDTFCNSRKLTKRKVDAVTEMKEMLEKKNEKTLKLKERIWNEKKRVEEQRTNAILALAGAIRSSKNPRTEEPSD